MSWGASGRGDWITVYAHGSHVYMTVAGIRFDTSGRDEDGTRWHDTKRQPRAATQSATRRSKGQTL